MLISPDNPDNLTQGNRFAGQALWLPPFPSIQPHSHATWKIVALTYTSPERNGRKTLTTVQGLPKKFDQKKILKVIKKKFGMSPYQVTVASTTRICY